MQENAPSPFTDLDLLYEISHELSYHLHHVLLHLFQAHALIQLGLKPVHERFDTENAGVTLHGDFDNRALIEIGLFPVHWKEVYQQILRSAEKTLETLENAIVDTYIISQGKTFSLEALEFSAYSQIWRNAGLQLVRRLEADLPARKILTRFYGSNRPLDALATTFEAYQTECYPDLFLEASEAEPDPEAEAETEADPLADLEAQLLGYFQQRADWEATEDPDEDDEDEEPPDEPFEPTR